MPLKPKRHSKSAEGGSPARPKASVKKTRKTTTAVKSKKRVAGKAAAKSAKTKVDKGKLPLDLSAFPPESVITLERWLCLACVADVFTRHLDLTARTAHLEIKRYVPSVAELYAANVSRPWFDRQLSEAYCPYCGSAAKWHACIYVKRIESGKATDILRRELVKSLPQSENQFVVLEEKATQQHAFFEWLEKISTGLDLDNVVWLRDVSRHYLSRKEPKTDWEAQFSQIHAIRRSRRLEEGWEVDSGRLFLAPHFFDELLLVQYLVSRSHKAGGMTLEGRYTLLELFTRLRNAGYLRAVGVQTSNPADALEQLVAYLGGGEAAIKFYHIVDRRDFLDKVNILKTVKPPKPRVR